MKSKIKKIIKYLLLFFLLFIIISFFYLFIGRAPEQEKINWGVNFSQKQAENLGLDWKETYLAFFNDLGAKNIKIAVYWDLIEKEEGKYNFEDLDWQIKKAEEKGVKLLLAIGQKTPRWPECHEPKWIKIQKSNIKNQKLLEYIGTIVERYRNSTAIWAWQVENEPFFPFGECPKPDENLLKKEIELVRTLDPQKRPVVISDSGEGSFWLRTAKLGDIVGVTLYRKVWSRELGIYLNYPFPPVFYWRKAQLVKKFFNKDVINVELQAEPWGPKASQDLTKEEREKTMSLEKFKENIEFAKKTGLKEFYLWGGEWWYWLKTKQNDKRIWNEAKLLFRS